MLKIFRILTPVFIFILSHYAISHAGKVQALTNQNCIAPYAIINKMTALPISTKQITIRVYETGGGDPAMNGNKIILNIDQWNPEGNSYTWDTGINIFELLGARFEKDQIRLECEEHVTNYNTGVFETVRKIYSITYSIDNSEKLENTIQITKQKIN